MERNILALGVIIEMKKMSTLMYGYPLPLCVDIMFLNFIEQLNNSHTIAFVNVTQRLIG